MKLKRKTASLIGITMTFYIVTLFLFIKPIFLNEAISMDEKSLMIDSKRVKSYIDARFLDLQRLNKDWAVWDDSYQFLKNENDSYIESNLTFETFENNEINFMIFVDKNKNIFYFKGYNLIDRTPFNLQKDTLLSEDLISKVIDHKKSLIYFDKHHGHILIESEPVLTSQKEGPSVGYILMGKVLNDNFFNSMKNELAVNFTVLNGDGQKEVSTPNSNTQIVKKITIGNDLNLEVIRERKYYGEKIKSINSFFASLTIGTLLLVMLVYFLLDFFILSRISLLSSQVKDVNFEKSFQLDVRNSKTENDEISDLEKAIQGMVGSLEKAHDEVSKLAFNDHLTGLPNRVSLYKAFEKIKEEKPSFALMFFDLDGFKRINDVYGHSRGDLLLKKLSDRLTQNSLSIGTSLFRIGGDEFVFLSNYSTRSSIIKEIESILYNLKNEFDLDKIKVTITSSIGVSIFPNDSETLDDLLQCADSALYEAKTSGKNTYVFYEDLKNKQLYKYLQTLKTDLMDVISSGQLYLEYQPIMHNSGRQVRSVEALIRWKHPEYGIISPLQFIPLAEDIGVIREIGRWVIKNAVKDISHWNKINNQSLSLALNVSKFQLKFRNELIQTLDNALLENDFSPEFLTIEITESDTVIEHEEIPPFIQEMKKRKIRVALDDFGVGSSSLFNLIKLNVDIIKIDRSFLQRVPIDSKDTILLKGIYEILNDLDIRVVTEGIETEEQFEFVSKNSSSLLQGYYFSKPLELKFLFNRFTEIESSSKENMKSS